MGIASGAVHLPGDRIDGKRARESGLRDGFEALRVPAWDEDPLTMAIEAGLRLPAEAFEDVAGIRLFLEEANDQAGLAAEALGVTAPVAVSTDPGGLLAELAAHADREELWLAAGSDVGGAGLAFRLGAEGSLEVEASTSLEAAPLDPDPATRLSAAFDELDPSGELERLAPPSLASLATQDPYGLGVGDAGPAAPGLELLAHRARSDEDVLVGGWGSGQAHALRLTGPRILAQGLETGAREIEPASYRQREQASSPPWSEASQGAYVSREVYDHDRARRYGARQRGGGEVAATTTIEAGPPGEFARQHEASGPYDVVIVSLDEGGREIGQAAVPPDTLSIGDRVRPVLRRVFSMENQTRYGLKWRPAATD